MCCTGGASFSYAADSVFIHKFLFDAISRRKYGEFHGTMQGKILDCILSPLGKEQRCKSEDEFNAFVSGYME